MPTIDYRSPLKCLVSVRGHPFCRDAFAAMFDDMPGVSTTMVDQPASSYLMSPEGMSAFDVLVLYDMPGLDFAAPVDSPGYVDPPGCLKLGLPRLLEQGKGIVALHHALAGWPSWSQYAEILGGRFLYHPAMVRGKEVLDSGFAHDVEQQLEIVADHPVTQGLPANFALTDEPYLAEIFEDDITPLVRSDRTFTRDKFFSAQNAVRGKMYSRENWDHPPGNNVVAWARQVVNSRLVYIQPGDGDGAYTNPHYRKLVENAIRWVADDGA